MSVRKNQRSLSAMEFFKVAVDMRRSVTLWLLRDFGIKRKTYNMAQVLTGLTEEEKKVVNDVYFSHGISENKEVSREIPEWFSDFEKKTIVEIIADISGCISQANSIYPNYEFEWNIRREYQDRAIADCYRLCHELQYIASVYPCNLNSLEPLLRCIEREVALLKGWRQSDNKKRKGMLTGKA